MPIQNALIKFTYIPRAQYNALPKDVNTYYAVVETDGKLRYYLGSTEFSYLPLTGGTLTDDLTMQKDGSTEVGSHGIVFQHNSTLSGGDATKELNVDKDGVLKFNGNTVWHAGNDGSGSGLDADTLDGKHITNSHSWDAIPWIAADGVMEVGKYLDFHEQAGDADDYDGRLYVQSNRLAYVQRGGDAQYLATQEYIAARGENLLTNGSGLLVNNYNFPDFTFDGSQAYYSQGAFKYIGAGTTFTSEVMPVNPELTYKLDFFARTATAAGGYYAFVACYDADGLDVQSIHHMYVANTLTTLAADLLPGATTITLTDSSNWNNGAGPDYTRSIIFWNYQNSYGYTYPPNTYSRNWYADMWAEGGINNITHVITLRNPWAGPAIPEGTYLSNGSAGGTYKYLALLNTYIPTAWTRYTDYMNGVDLTGTNAGNKFPPGTAKVKLGWLMNYTGTTETAWFANLSFGLHVYSPDNANKTSVLWNASDLNLSGDLGRRIGFNIYDAFTFGGYPNAQYGITNMGASGLVLSGYFGLRLFTAGVERLSILSDGNVGIGTSTPTRPLEVANPFVGMLVDLATTGGHHYGLAENGTEQWWLRSVGGDFRFHENGVGDTVTIKAGGNVGIGNTNPYYRLDVNIAADSTDGIRLRRDGGSYPTNWLFYSGAADTKLRLYTSISGAKDVMTFDTNGNIGIGTDSPQQRLSVIEATNYAFPTLGAHSGNFGILKFDGTPGGNYGLLIGITTQGNVWQQVQRVAGDASAYHLILQPSGGNVGIGTVSTNAPEYKLQVTESVYPGIGLYSTYDYSENRNWAFKTNSFGTGTWGGIVLLQSSANQGTPDTARFGIDINGNVGIGTATPSSKLSVAGSMEMTMGANRRLRIGSASNYRYDLSMINDDFGIYEADLPTPRLFFKYHATLKQTGINTNAPDAPLTIYGINAMTSGWDRTLSLESNYPVINFRSIAGGRYAGIGYDGSSLNAGFQIWTYAPSNDVVADTPVVSIRNDKRVGIGTTAPSARLHVAGPVNSWESGLQLTGTGTGGRTFGMYVTDTGLQITDENVFASRLMIDNNGNIGIGVVPAQKLDLNGNISLGTWIKAGNTYVGLRRQDTGEFGAPAGGDSGLVIESYNHVAPYEGNYSQKVHLRTHVYNGSSHNALTAYGTAIGIGTTTPNARLEVSAGDNADMFKLSYSYAPDSYYLRARQVVTSSNVRWVFNQVNNGVDYDSVLAFNSGRVGIGTYEPMAKLHVYANADNDVFSLTHSAAGGGNWAINPFIYGVSNAGLAFEDRLNSTRPFTIYSSGKVEVSSISSYGDQLIISSKDDSTTVYKTAGMLMQLTDSVGTRKNAGSIFSISEDYNAINVGMAFYTRASDTTIDAMRISSGGNVGIANVNPLVKLDVRGTAIITNQAGDNWNENLRLPEAASGWASIALGGSIQAQGISANQWGIAKGSAAYNHKFLIRYGSSNQEMMAIDTAGNVGIGTISPDHRLHIVGSHANTRFSLHFYDANPELVARLNMWASEPGTSFYGTGIGNNMYTKPYVDESIPGDPQLIGINNQSYGASGIRFNRNIIEFLSYVANDTGVYTPLLLQHNAVNVNNTSIINVPAPTDTHHATNKSYVDTTFAGNRTTTGDSPLISKLSGYKSFVLHHPAINHFIIAPSASVNGIDWDWANEFRFYDNGNVSAKTFQSTVATGTAPFTVASTTAVTYLNADLLDGYHSDNLTYSGIYYNQNWITLGYGNLGVEYWHKMADISIVSPYTDYAFQFKWASRYSQGEGLMHVHTDDNTTPQVFSAVISHGSSYAQKAPGDFRYVISGTTISVWVLTQGWQAFKYIREDAVTEAGPTQVWYNSSNTTSQTADPGGTSFNTQSGINAYTLQGYAASNFALTSSLANYLPLASGGTLGGDLILDKISNDANSDSRRLKFNFKAVGEVSDRELYVNSSGILTLYDNVNNFTIWHSGNDGSGSGLDADTVDGYDAAHTPYDNTARTYSPFVQFTQQTSNLTENPDSDWWSTIKLLHNNATGYFTQLGLPFHSNNLSWRRLVGGTQSGWYKIWHEGNQGTGTGMDADKVDGKHTVVCSQATYNSLTPDANTIYFIVG